MAVAVHQPGQDAQAGGVEGGHVGAGGLQHLPGGPGGHDPSAPDRHRPVGDQVQLSLQAPPARTAPVEDAGELGGVDDIQVRWHGTSGKPKPGIWNE